MDMEDVESISRQVERRLDEKERGLMRNEKMRKSNNGSKVVSKVEAEYMEKHDVISQQQKRPDPEDNFSFHPPLWNQRLGHVAAIVNQNRSQTIIDYGCGSGKFINFMRSSKNIDREFFGVDIDEYELHTASNACSPYPADYLNKRDKKFIVHLLHGSILEPEEFLRDKDCLVCIEVMEHILRPQADELADVVLGYLRPKLAIFTTPNQDFNVIFSSLRSGLFRHWDHKFEMTRKQFQAWGNSYAQKYNYKVGFSGVGAQPDNYPTNIGFCSQVAVFERFTSAEIMFIPEKQKLRKVHEIRFPVEEPMTKEEFLSAIESNLDYYYRLHCKNQVPMDYDPEYNIWAPLSAILGYKCKIFEQITDKNMVLNVIEHSILFELNEERSEMRGTPEYVRMNDPMAEDDYY